MKRKASDSEEGWDYLERGFTKLKRIFEGLQERAFNLEDYMMLYTIVYDICCKPARPHHDEDPDQMYDKYQQILADYMPSKVLPYLREKHDEYDLLRELLKSWANHKFLAKWLSRVFLPLQAGYIPRMALPELNAFGLSCFRDLVFEAIKDKVKDAVIALIDREREGEEIDRTLVKNVLDLFVEIEDMAAYYSRKASNWILQDSFDYLVNVGECLKNERERASHYLQPSSNRKLADILSFMQKGEFRCRQLLRGHKLDGHSIICCYSKKSKNELAFEETLEKVLKL
ncbi:hypothetical protein CUMW_204560 [Citrus unshiu]|uniref:Cullin N-terminal domain-containing protein n=1 Tax=Citrus unshiu TaxID=55188 RepID=A0A2H5Q893_CITUN|nr:hypothetical protein CUMW_204560 [Citrus unshiu]